MLKVTYEEGTDAAGDTETEIEHISTETLKTDKRYKADASTTVLQVNPLESVLKEVLKDVWRLFSEVVIALDTEHDALVKNLKRNDEAALSVLKEEDYRECQTVELKGKYDVHFAAPSDPVYLQDLSDFKVTKCRLIERSNGDLKRMLVPG